MTTSVVSCRVTENLARMIRKCCEKGMYINKADFIRDAIREKIQHESPHLYHEAYDENS